MDGPETGGFCRPSCRLRGRSQPAPPARVIPAGRQLRDDGATPAPALLKFLEDPAHAPHHSPHRGPRRALPHAPLRRVPGPADVPILNFNPLEHPLFPGFAGFSVPPRARIGIVSRITTRGSPARRPPHTGTAERLRTVNGGTVCKRSVVPVLGLDRGPARACTGISPAQVGSVAKANASVSMVPSGPPKRPRLAPPMLPTDLMMFLNLLGQRASRTAS